jgi:hypothetical protein
MNQDWLKNQRNYITALEKPAILFFPFFLFTFATLFLMGKKACGPGAGVAKASAGKDFAWISSASAG